MSTQASPLRLADLRGRLDHRHPGLDDRAALVRAHHHRQPRARPAWSRSPRCCRWCCSRCSAARSSTGSGRAGSHHLRPAERRWSWARSRCCYHSGHLSFPASCCWSRSPAPCAGPGDGAKHAHDRRPGRARRRADGARHRARLDGRAERLDARGRVRRRPGRGDRPGQRAGRRRRSLPALGAPARRGPPVGIGPAAPERGAPTEPRRTVEQLRGGLATSCAATGCCSASPRWSR